MITKPRLLFASSKNSDMFYGVRTIVPDSCFLLEIDDKRLIFLDKRDIETFREHDTNKRFEAVSLEKFMAKADETSSPKSRLARIALAIIRQYLPEKISIEVPCHFPLDLADALRSEGIELEVKNPFYSERSIKKQSEIDAIENAIERTRVAYKMIEEILIHSTIKDKFITYKGTVLTSEFLKKEIDMLLLNEGLLNTEGIVIASGAQAAMPHNSGSGPLLAHEPIICDIFPRDTNTGYFSDMTRTYVKGTASESMKKIYEAVKIAQETAIANIKPGVTGAEIHTLCVNSFLKVGYGVGDTGFIHNTGHGLGLDLHEGPYLSGVNKEPLVVGNIVTVEPGLYYEKMGSVRIEDVVVVTETGCRNLTEYPKVLEIM
ncbi:MAG: Xaa-Pro peptidase family protein [bacterium]|nr:Xaa-Pro peptidase family protein [bacterium]